MNDQSTVRLVIAVLGALALAVVIGGIVLAFDDKSMPEALIAMGAGGAGAIAGILSRTSNPEIPQPVEVVNVVGDPVPVDPVPAKAAAKKGTRKRT